MYEMVYTSPTGLYRYRTGDIIRIVDFFNQTPIYEFVYRSEKEHSIICMFIRVLYVLLFLEIINCNTPVLSF